MIETGRGPASLVLFPAVGDNATSYKPLLAILADALDGVARVVAIDPPGYGQAILKGGAIPKFHELLAWAERLGAQYSTPTIFAGNSSGGAIAAAAASAVASSSRGLVLIGWPDWRVAQPPLETLVPRDLQGLEMLLQRSWHSPPSIAPNMARILLARYATHHFREHVYSFDPLEATAYYDRCEGPLLFVGGESDKLVQPEALQESVEKRAGSQLRLIPACGHFPHKEAAAALANALLEFMASFITTGQSRVPSS